MASGKIKFFNERKGFGFIVDDETHSDVFVHATGLKEKVNENDEVTFEVAEDKRGKKAVEVKKK